MFINKIGVTSNIGFKSINNVVNNVGETVKRFNYVYDYNNEECECQIYRVKRLENFNYVLLDKEPIKTIKLKPDGVDVNLSRITNIGKDEAFAYKIVRKDKNGNIIWQGADTGVKMRQDKNGELVFRVHLDKKTCGDKTCVLYNDDGTIKYKDGKPVESNYYYETDTDFKTDSRDNYQYTLITQNGTTPFRQGLGILSIPDSLLPGARYREFDEDNTGEIVYDADLQRKKERMVKTISNKYGGSMAGIEAMIPEWRKQGFSVISTTPIASGDNRTDHGYYNKHNLHVSENMGNSENYDSLMVTEFKNNMSHLFDTTLTSFGIESIPIKYINRWGVDAQMFDWIKANGYRTGNLSFGTVPTDAENMSHRVINSPFITKKQSDGTYKIITNDNYNPKQKTSVQLYDKSQVTKEQVDALNQKEIEMYNELNAGRDLKITSSHDTTISYVFDINPNEYIKNINKINDLIKNEGKNIDLFGPDGTLIAMQFSNFGIDKNGSGYVAWDANPDMFLINYGVSAYDEKELQSITDRAERQYWQNRQSRGAKEALDMSVQSVKYWIDKTKTAHTLYTLQTLGTVKSADEIQELINKNLLPRLPEKNKMTQTVVNNILNGEYYLSPKGILSKDDATVKALMNLPLDSLEFDDDIVEILTTSYFSNRATTDDTIGISRFNLMKNNNPHLIKPYEKVYNNVNKLFQNELKDFAHSIIKKVNEKSNEPLINSDGSYTEYGEYVIELLGKNITKYAMLKALSGDSFKYKMLPNGILTYDYKNIKKATTLKALNINASNPTEEAEILYNRISKGIKTLNEQDIEAVAKSISTVIKGTDTDSFRLAEAFVDRAGLELNLRLDAAKNTMDIDSIRNRDADFDDTWLNLIYFWKTIMKGVRECSPHSNIKAEMTDVPDVIRDTFGGANSCPYNNLTNVNGVKFNGEPDAMTKFFNETGITSEAAYSYFFTELLTSFSRDFETGERMCDTHDDFKLKYELLMNTRNADYLKNLLTFVGNHDKARSIHGLALDMQLFHSTLIDEPGKCKRQQRNDVIRVLSGAKSMDEVPLELRLNVDNMEYFRTVSTRAIAQTKHLMDSIYEDLDGIASNEDKQLLIQALIDITNGNYLNSKNSERMERIQIPELSSIENAVNEIAKIAGGTLSDTEKREIIKKAKELNTENYLVHGDFNWDDKIGENNKKLLKEILGDDNDPMRYSLYTVQIARMIRDASKGSISEAKINNALKEFVKTYNREKISQNMYGFKMYDDFTTARKKNSYAAQDFRVALEEAFNQVEYKTGRKINNQEKIIATVYNSVTEPAVKKHAMMLSFLSALCGMPTIFAGDEYGDTGYEDKSKNPNVKNRNASRISEIERNTLMGKIMRRNKDVTYDALKAKVNLKPLRDGSSYSMDIMYDGKSREQIFQRIGQIDTILNNLSNGNSEFAKKLKAEKAILRNHLAQVAFMMQSDDGDMAISILNAAGIDHNNRVNYYDKLGLKTKADREKFLKDNNIESINPNNPYIPIQEKVEFDAVLMGAGITIPIGTMFINADSRDKAKYVVKQIKDKVGIVREDGKKIIMDGLTAKNGAMILKKIAFKGRSNVNSFYNMQYNFAVNPYKFEKSVENGKKLSLISK